MFNNKKESEFPSSGALGANDQPFTFTVIFPGTISLFFDWCGVPLKYTPRSRADLDVPSLLNRSNYPGTSGSTQGPATTSQDILSYQRSLRRTENSPGGCKLHADTSISSKGPEDLWIWVPTESPQPTHALQIPRDKVKTHTNKSQTLTKHLSPASPHHPGLTTPSPTTQADSCL